MTLGSTNSKTVDLGIIYDCTKVILIVIFDYSFIVIFDYSLLHVCNYRICKTNDPFRSYNAELHKYEPKVSTFYIYHCQCYKITRTCYYKNSFKGTTLSRYELELPVSGRTCLQATKNKTVNVSSAILTLQKTGRHNW